jgi:hypothetical protein
MNLEGAEKAFLDLDAAWVRRIVDDDCELTPYDRDMLVRAIDEFSGSGDSAFMHVPRMLFLLYSVFHRSHDSFAWQYIGHLSKRTRFFGEMAAYMEGAGLARGAMNLDDVPLPRAKWLSCGYNDVNEDSVRDQLGVWAAPIVSGIFPSLYDLVFGASERGDTLATFFDSENGFLIFGEERQVEHSELMSAVHMSYGGAMPELIYGLLGPGDLDLGFDMTLLRTSHQFKEIRSYWISSVRKLIARVEPFAHGVHVMDEQAVVELSSHSRPEGKRVSYWDGSSSGQLGAAIMTGAPVLEVAPQVVFDERRMRGIVKNARRIDDGSRFIMKRGDGELIDLNRDIAEDDLICAVGTDVDLIATGGLATAAMVAVNSLRG